MSSTGRSDGHAIGIDVTFRELSVTAPRTGWLLRHGPAAVLLQSATGAICSGQLTALIGPSGAGKTSFMDALAGRTPSALMRGSVWYGQEKASPGVLARLLSYVEQQDMLIGNLTVVEMLMYTWELRSPVGAPWAEGLARVEEVLRELGLQGCRHTHIGSAGGGRGVSGGERRRVSIGAALVTSPAVLLLDEPTSGLDSSAALEVVAVLRRQAQRGATVLASVHQPSARLLSHFDALIMAAGGHLVYQGANGVVAQAYLQQQFPAAAASVDAALPLPDWLLDCLEQASRGGHVVEQGRSDIWHEHGRQSLLRLPSKELSLGSLCKHPSEDLPTYTASPQPRLVASPTQRSQGKGVWGCLYVLLKYRMRADCRSPRYLLPRILDKVAVAVVFATLFLHTGSETGATAVQNTYLMLFMWILIPALACAGFIPTLSMETELFVRERHAGLYPIVSYLLAKMAGEFLVIVPVTTALAAMVWFLTSLSGSFLLFWLPYLVSMAIGIFVAYFFSAVAPTLDVNVLLLTAYLVSMVMFAGLVCNWADIPGYWRWYSYLVYMRWAWGAVIANQFSGDPHGAQVLAYYHFDGLTAWDMFGIQCAFLFAFFLLTWAALWAREALPRVCRPTMLRTSGCCGAKPQAEGHGDLCEQPAPTASGRVVQV